MSRLRIAVACSLLLGGCASFGGTQLVQDQLEYARALDRSQKQQTLWNIVSLRYANTPTFLPVTQVIAGYSFDRSGTLGFGTSFGGGAPNTGSLGANFAYSNRPTFTYTPTSGQDFAENYIRPLAPSLVLPLVQNGVPIDVLFRVAVQSIGPWNNSAALSGPSASGSPEFFELIHAFRRLQLEGALAMNFVRDGNGDHVYLEIDVGPDENSSVRGDAARVLKLLKVPRESNAIEIRPGPLPRNVKAVAIVMRSIVGMLTELGAQIEVPESDVQARATLPTVRAIGGETRPPIVVNVAEQGAKAPEDAYASIEYRGNRYWINGKDFDSKFAFSAVQTLIALAQTSKNAPPPMVTIPAN